MIVSTLMNHREYSSLELFYLVTYGIMHWVELC